MPKLQSDSPKSLGEARRRERISQAKWRKQRAEVARLVAAGEEEAARKLLAEAGLSMRSSPAQAKSPAKWEASPDADSGLPADETPTVKSISAKPTSAEAIRRAPKSTKKPARKEASPSAQAKAKRLQRAVKPSRRRRRSTKTWKAWFQSRPPWATSLAVHSVLVVVFGLLSFATLGEPAFSLSLAMDEDAWEETAAEVTLTELDLEAEMEPAEAAPDLSPSIDLAALAEPMAPEPVELVVAELGDTLAISAESLAVEAATAGTGGGENGKGEEAKAAEAKLVGKPGKVSFFGAESRANRVVFVVDNSGSMQRGRMETTLMELDRAISRLSASQEFYVIFYSDQAYPMFFPESIDEPIPATRPNKRKLNKWLHSVEMCLGGRLLDAMDLAAGMEPDAVFLLSDGDIRSKRVTERMTKPDAWGFTIHTLGMGARLPQHAELLVAIAKANGGVFRLVQAHPKAVARSRVRPIPYHREAGTVWGSAVTPWR